MSSRGIVSAKSEIPGNRHHWMIAVPSHSAGSGSASGLGSPKGTKGVLWCKLVSTSSSSWGRGKMGLSGYNTRLKSPLGVDLEITKFPNLDVWLRCVVSEVI